MALLRESRRSAGESTRTGFIGRPSPLAFGGLLLVIVFLGALVITPMFGDTDPLDFWWARVAPRSYAVHFLRTTGSFIVWDATPSCTERAMVWATLTHGPQADSVFASLYTQAGPAGRLYALAGLATVHASGYAAAFNAARTDTTAVWLSQAKALGPHGAVFVTVADSEWLRHHVSSGFRKITIEDLVTDSSVARWASTFASTYPARCAT
jgi:hypothetical protein